MASFRAVHLEQVYAGLVKSGGVDLVTWTDKGYGPGGVSDDIGMFYWIPKIASWFHVPLGVAENYFFEILIYLPIVLGCIGFFFLFRRKLAPTLIACIGTVIVAQSALKILDVYVTFFTALFTLVPALLVFVRKERKGWGAVLFTSFSVFSGLMIGALHIIRSHSATAVLLLFLWLLFTVYPGKLKQKLVLTFAIFLGLAASLGWFTYETNIRDSFLKENQEAYVPVIAKHPFWHTAYIGLGYIENPYGIIYLDENAAAKVQELRPGTVYLSAEYEQTLKSEYFRVAKDNTSFFLLVYWQKLVQLLEICIYNLRYSLILLILFRKPWQIELGLFSIIIFMALFPLMAVPNTMYLFGLQVSLMLYNLVSIGWFISEYPRLRQLSAEGSIWFKRIIQRRTAKELL